MGVHQAFPEGPGGVQALRDHWLLRHGYDLPPHMPAWWEVASMPEGWVQQGGSMHDPAYHPPTPNLLHMTLPVVPCGPCTPTPNSNVGPCTSMHPMRLMHSALAPNSTVGPCTQHAPHVPHALSLSPQPYCTLLVFRGEESATLFPCCCVWTAAGLMLRQGQAQGQAAAAAGGAGGVAGVVQQVRG